ncbi:hypothetical protein DFH06DRAFT_1320825 [Mycena polygramma]|nr:hypothetical protein DFH06DRAFT_1320825 [Mycena polygramma]
MPSDPSSAPRVRVASSLFDPRITCQGRHPLRTRPDSSAEQLREAEARTERFKQLLCDKDREIQALRVKVLETEMALLAAGLRREIAVMRRELVRWNAEKPVSLTADD